VSRGAYRRDEAVCLASRDDAVVSSELVRSSAPPPRLVRSSRCPEPYQLDPLSNMNSTVELYPAYIYMYSI
jgi:hypothetical protein